MKHTVILYATHLIKEYWEVDLPSGTDIESVARQVHDDPSVVIRELEGDMVDSDHVQTFSLEFKTMYETFSRNPILNSDLEVSTVETSEANNNNEQFRNGFMK